MCDISKIKVTFLLLLLQYVLLLLLLILLFLLLVLLQQQVICNLNPGYTFNMGLVFTWIQLNGTTRKEANCGGCGKDKLISTGWGAKKVRHHKKQNRVDGKKQGGCGPKVQREREREREREISSRQDVCVTYQESASLSKKQLQQLEE